MLLNNQAVYQQAIERTGDEKILGHGIKKT